jgi:formylglycine-generating enzyme required for sulfatase activity
MGKFEITIGQYAQFLNAVAATDTYGLYNTSMSSDGNIKGIARNGVSGNYTYSTIGSPNRPIAYVSWGDAARFANWLTNGQPNGAQGPSTTETGSYTLNGATTNAALQATTRDANARYVIPTENEWYKAAYYDPTMGGSNYWLYAMRTDAVPYSDQPPGTTSPSPAFAANFSTYDGIANGYNDGFAVTGNPGFSFSTNYLTDVGAYTSALSYYGTFDQGGNLDEWDEALISATLRGLRGGSWGDSELGLRCTIRESSFGSTEESIYFGFRIAEVPEPATVLLLLAALPMLRRPRERIAR